MTKEARKIADALQRAVNEEMVRKAKLGYKAVVADNQGRVKVISAKYVVRKMRAEGLF